MSSRLQLLVLFLELRPESLRFISGSLGFFELRLDALNMQLELLLDSDVLSHVSLQLLQQLLVLMGNVS